MSKSITQQEVRHVATLARLRLTDDEVQTFARELAGILDYVNQLKEVDVEGTEPTAHVVALRSVFRTDEAQPSLEPETALSNAPQREASFFKVPKVLEQDTA